MSKKKASLAIFVFCVSLATVAADDEFSKKMRAVLGKVGVEKYLQALAVNMKAQPDADFLGVEATGKTLVLLRKTSLPTSKVAAEVQSVVRAAILKQTCMDHKVLLQEYGGAMKYVVHDVEKTPRFEVFVDRHSCNQLAK